MKYMSKAERERCLAVSKLAPQSTTTVEHGMRVTRPFPCPERDRLYKEFKSRLLESANEICKMYGREMQQAANVLQFAVPPRYTQEQLETAFKAVQPKDHWKNPINAFVFLNDADIELTTEAIIHFTGGGAIEFIPVKEDKRVVNGKRLYQVTAPGYYVVTGA